MDNSKITIKFDTSYIDRENKFSLIESYIRNFLARHFPNIEFKENIRIILADSVVNVKRKITGNESIDIDNSMASVTYLDGQYIIVLPIGGFKMDVFPEEAKHHTENFIKSVKLEMNQLIYHEIQHVKNWHDY